MPTRTSAADPSRSRRRGAGVLVAATAAVAVGIPLLLAAPSATAASTQPSLTLLSSPRPDRVSGGDALLAVDAAGARVRVTVDGADVTEAFRPDGDRLVGLVDGMSVGRHRVRATALAPGRPSSVLTLTNAPAQGPMFSGPREKPFVCRTADFTTLAGTSLGAPTDRATCAAPTRVEYVYRSRTDRSLKPLADPSDRPADLATTTTSTGARVPYVVRVETGVINRSIYEVAVLDAATDAAGPVSVTRPPTGWNGRLLYTFGGGCPGGWFTQGATTGGVGDDWMLGQGYAVASSSLNVFGNNCQPVTAAETMAMTKEHVVETLGVPTSTIGIGCSGGSYQVFALGDSYPGLLDGILAGCVFPEVDFATLHTITDARLLQVWFEQHPGWTDAQKQAVAGFGRVGTIDNLGESGRRIDPRVFCPTELPVARRYDPATNPGGARCDVYSHQRNIFGTLPGTDGRIPLRPLDNVGIEYGRDALRTGGITVDQFLDLNAGIGGFDRDADVVPRRTVADRSALTTAYRTGQMVQGSRLGSVPVIELREYTDELENGDIHLRFHSFAFRQRLVDANGDADNHAMWTQPQGSPFGSTNPQFTRAISQLDRWTTSLDRRTPTTGTDLPSHAAVVSTKPEGLADACWSPQGRKVTETQVPGIDNTRCNTWYPVHPSPRMVAGGPIANDVIACRLQPVDPASYGVRLTTTQIARLRQVFPQGTCNWSRPGVGDPGAAPVSWPVFPG